MIETPDIVDTEEQAAAVIPFVIPREEMQQVMRPAIEELIATVTEQGAGITGPVFAHHFRMNPDTFDFELGVPVDFPVTRSGRVQPGRLPAATVARTVYHGPYEGLPEAWGKFDECIEANGHSPGSEIWESYVAGPHSSPDAADWRTELNRLLAGRS